jgi:hypothetical protein
VHDGNIEVLPSSADGVSDGLGVVGLNAFELLHEFFELLDRIGLVTGRDALRQSSSTLAFSCSESLTALGCEAVSQ